jgi:glycerol-3-phosphate dehydrogenase (NAD(P)+)
MTRVAVLGGGSWGTAFSMILADAGCEVALWTRRPELAEAINDSHENPDYLPGIALPEAVVATSDPVRALERAEVVVLAVPSQTLRENLTRWGPMLPEGCVLVSLMKGIELGTSLRMSEVIAEVTGAGPERIAVVSGPNLAKEIARRQPAASVVACADEAVAEKLQQTFMTPYFRPYTNTDVVGVELGGAVKNVIALAVGMAEGMGMGDNSQASIITRGLAEITRLGLALGADAATFAGLAGVGDLVATCMSPLSRNRTFGENLGRGLSLEEVVAMTRQTAEGVKSAESILALARAHRVDMPIVEHVVAAVHDGLPPTEIVRRIMSRSAKPETA